MKKRLISFSPPDISELEIAEVTEALRSGWITTGPRTKKLEKRLGEFCRVKNVVCLNSATAAEELNFRILGIQPGDEIIIPAYTYTASASAAIHAGATVIFVDSQKDGDPITGSPEMDYEAMENAITERTKAIVPVDLGGIMCNYERIYQAVENKKGLFHSNNSIQKALGRVAIVSDCAHSFGANRNGFMAGKTSDFASYSFHAVKNLTTAEGGASVWNIPGVNQEEIYHMYQLYSLHGQSKDALAKTKLGTWEYDIVGPWYKCNMTDIMAAIGLRQLDRYSELLQRRKEIIEMYDVVCDELGIFHLKHYGKDYNSSGHLYWIRVPGIKTEQRNEIIEKLAERGIATNVHYKPLPMMSAYKAYGWDIKDFPNAYDYYHNLITLPLHTQMSDEDLDYVIWNFKKVVKKYI
ncbi:DegT/DnrJ/EryC1/StrS family aminotransferase [Enterococcus avium]|uniref:DegT/DnrJ/EryC1/StrS family aminotransferase n=1 Tax=Enterococcus avium TaxID=33945 RepID=UPI00232B5B3C|nr:DegT/DnrJ/EryC1/StrS family aminotransferase [Enterococcus avium]MDB1750809.1 DegT/DnrJ/EryC1/StrS family aminotransferase [Enterococcus avium]MDB1754865.1 DegT/DnrJ/EryC1/StrS family aminotransferase [Enterococcus avium]MDB1761951.1 DegT/DnrJ/EryC1/StrS family aminotransferase [Enterococcus avium]